MIKVAACISHHFIHKQLQGSQILRHMGNMASFNTPDEVKSAAAEPGAVFLDVRTQAELKEESLTAKPFKHATCSLGDCSELMAKAEELLPDKNGTVWTT